MSAGLLITPGLSAAAINPLPYLQRVILTANVMGRYNVAFWDAGDLATLFQDTAETVPVTAPGQSVARLRDKFGFNHLTFDAGKQPVYAEAGGVGYLDCGAGTCAGYTSTVDLSFWDEVTVVCGLRKISDATAQRVMSFGNAPGTDVGAWVLDAPGLVGVSQLRFGAKGGGALQSSPVNGVAAPVSGVLSGYANLSTNALRTRWNGLDKENTAASLGGGLLGTERLFVLSGNNGAALPFTGHWFGGLVWAGPLEDRIRNAGEAFFELKTGVY